MPKVSVLVPIYNSQNYLPKCLNSILCQTFDNLQIVLLDDGSTDNSYSIAYKYAIKDSRIELYHQNNSGVADTRNKLLSFTNGDYILFVDSDDWLELDMIEFLITEQSKSNADMTTCGMVLNDRAVANQYIKKIYTKDKAIENFLYHTEFRGSLWNKLLKSSIIRDIRFASKISYGEDALFVWHFLQKVEKVTLTNKQLYHYRMNENSLSHSCFNGEKLTGHYVWEQICEETSQWWPEYLHIAQARHCIEDVLLLRNAAHCGYNVKEDIQMLQKSIKKYRYTLSMTNIASLKMKLYILIATNSYFLAGII